MIYAKLKPIPSTASSHCDNGICENWPNLIYDCKEKRGMGKEERGAVLLLPGALEYYSV